MSENPDAIRADIEATRARLGTNVDAVADKVTPVQHRPPQTDKVKDAVFGVKEKVMGAADDATTRAARRRPRPHRQRRQRPAATPAPPSRRTRTRSRPKPRATRWPQA